eukprot:COSAG01_NODE_68_length_28978_cov_182.027777_35_plen_149_part_00
MGQQRSAHVAVAIHRFETRLQLWLGASLPSLVHDLTDLVQGQLPVAVGVKATERPRCAPQLLRTLLLALHGIECECGLRLAPLCLGRTQRTPPVPPWLAPLPWAAAAAVAAASAAAASPSIRIDHASRVRPAATRQKSGRLDAWAAGS